jgi:hypothetical protein
MKVDRTVVAMRTNRIDETDLMLGVLSALLSDKKFGHDEISQAFGCSIEFVEIVAEYLAIYDIPMNPMTYEILANFLGVSPQAVGQWEKRAMMRMQHPSRMKILEEARAGLLA